MPDPMQISLHNQKRNRVNFIDETRRLHQEPVVSVMGMLRQSSLRTPAQRERTVTAIRQTGQIVSGETLAHLSPLKWEHINLTGDYHWRKDAGLRNRKSRPLRTGKPGLIP